MLRVPLDEEEEKKRDERSDIRGDRVNMLMLILLCFLQGAVIGISNAFPLIMQNRKVSYMDQAQYSITDYPICFKLLWAPIVDCVYSKKMGRRKTWLIPMQYLMGISLLIVSMNVDNWLDNRNGTRKPEVGLITATFFLCMLFAAVEGIAIEGWSTTLLQRRNLGYVGLCQSVGGTTGVYATYILLIMLDSKDFCNKFRTVPLDHGFVSVSDFIFWWSIALLIANTLIFLFKKDNSLEVIADDENQCRLGLKESYVKLWQVIHVRPIIIFSLILLTCRIGSGTGYISTFKMIEAGVSQEYLVLYSLPAFPVQMILSVVFRHSITGPRAMRSYVFNYILKLILSTLFFIILYLAPNVKGDSQALPLWYLLVILVTSNMSGVIDGLMSISLIGFLFRVSDARYGGIYITLLGTVLNIGINWPTTLSLTCVDWLTVKTCVKNGVGGTQICHTKIDGFYVETVIFTILGALWLVWARKSIYKLEDLEASAWMLGKKKAAAFEDEKEMEKEADPTVPFL